MKEQQGQHQNKNQEKKRRCEYLGNAIETKGSGIGVQRTGPIWEHKDRVEEGVWRANTVFGGGG